MEVSERDKPLLRAFLEREALDYLDKGSNFVDHRMKMIEQGLKEYKGRADYLLVKSLSNVGLLSRELTLTPTPWGDEGVVDITLCTCGSNDCWGTITFPNKKAVGRKVVIPIK